VTVLQQVTLATYPLGLQHWSSSLFDKPSVPMDRPNARLVRAATVPSDDGLFPILFVRNLLQPESVTQISGKDTCGGTRKFSTMTSPPRALAFRKLFIDKKKYCM
jgi:hypothetical protein